MTKTTLITTGGHPTGEPGRPRTRAGHTHRALTGKARDLQYQGPVVTDGYGANPAAHGNICRVDVCSCGAERRTNINQQHVECGTWELLRAPCPRRTDGGRCTPFSTRTNDQRQCEWCGRSLDRDDDPQRTTAKGDESQ